jgi:hypothetical protein
MVGKPREELENHGKKKEHDAFAGARPQMALFYRSLEVPNHAHQVPPRCLLKLFTIISDKIHQKLRPKYELFGLYG